MINTYRIEPSGNHFIVIDPWGERLVEDYSTEEAAKQDIERYRKEDTMWETARLLMDVALKTFMEIRQVDRETASYWIRSAAEGV